MKIPVTCATVAKRLRNPLAALRCMVDVASWQAELGLTLAEVGLLIGEAHPNGHGGRPYDKSSIWHWKNGRALTPEAQAAFALATDRIIRERTKGWLTVRARFYKQRWKFTAYAACACGCACRRKFSPDRMEQTRCPRCRKKHRAILRIAEPREGRGRRDAP